METEIFSISVVFAGEVGREVHMPCSWFVPARLRGGAGGAHHIRRTVIWGTREFLLDLIRENVPTRTLRKGQDSGALRVARAEPL